ncbi:SDR family oxidoreductase [Paracoccus shanxieyensis]|uniref:SDR family oxidoreductase n=1 Tax=Paracoccus shanxieyensis TaxID=2675752 RepID=A0A6L6IYF3_9RHOB|nr:SDR family NAD(P)-dependent oxidoreductase [Paracoccus shanxieyensis]MTH65273.1 SDR family oxidoreductase [Paracoccus shanxieyensis]MTH88423.1 SDR family oxidoreductase [Paracoccus shanxieyensis]
MNKIDLNGRLAVVTGAAQGIGYAVAQRFIDSGARVIIWDRDGDAAARAAEALGPQASARAVELAEDAQIDAAAAAAGPVDILINNAGITGGNGKTWDLAPTVWRQVIEVNLNAPYVACRALIPGMIERGYGRIVNVASIAAKEGNPNAAHYSASKAGLIALTKSLGKELAGTGVLVNAITPAAARTPIFDQMTQEHIDYMLAKIPMNRFLEPAEAAALVAWLASEDCAFSTGAVFDISGGRATY